MGGMRLGITAVSKKAIVGELDKFGMFKPARSNDLTEDFKRCIVTYCSESVEFEVDGMKFKATCERIG